MSAWFETRSHFSIGESLLTPTEIVEQASEQGATTIALTDTMRISGMVEFTKACRAKGIKPIIGARLRVVNSLAKEKTKDQPYFLRYLAKTEKGYRDLLAILSRSFDADHFYSVPRLLLSDIIELATPGACLVTLGAFYGAHGARQGRDVALALRGAGIDVASDIVPLATPHFARVASDALALSAAESVPCVLALPFFYKNADQADSLDLMRSIAAHTPFDDRAARYVPRDLVAKRPSDWNLNGFVEMVERLYGVPVSGEIQNALRYTKALPDEFTYEWKKDMPSLPEMASDPFAELISLCTKGWTDRLGSEVFGYKPSDLKPYKERLKYELSVLKRLKFENYFLLVTEIVNWSKTKGIRVGPARGSVAGSLVAFLLGITDVDPLRFNLLFERFINPDRIDLPDADLDFMSTRRQEIIEYVKDRFGHDYVAGVSNYNTMGAASALKDTCAKLNITGNNFAFSKLVPKEHGQGVSLTEALKESPELAKFARENLTAVMHALNLEDRMRAYGQHAAGVVVAGVPLSERAVVETRDGNAIVNWDKVLVEDFGLVKMDILGLTTLDMIDISVRHIFNNHGKKINLYDVPLDDPAVLSAFGRGETVGIFQMEGAAARKMLRDMAMGDPLRFEDLVAVNALNRPGPIDAGLVSQYIKRRNGEEKVTYLHPIMESALKETFGVLAYQEQLMQVSRDLCGFTAAEADVLRKAVGKKDAELMEKQKDKFIDGAVAGGMERSAAEAFWQDVAGFAAYSFNKSHSVAYSIIGYLTMWLKVYYPAEFFCGFLTMVKEDRRPAALSDMKRLGISLLPPDINESTNQFEAFNSTTLMMPFSAIKGITENTGNAILEERSANGRFTGIDDFTKRINGRKCNTRQTENLDKVGAFARVESGQLPANDHTRRRDQVELLAGLIQDTVIVDRDGLTFDHFTVPQLAELLNEYRTLCKACDLSGLCHPKPWVRGAARVMVVLDGPSSKEERADEMAHGSYVDALEEALDQIGLSMNDVYVTSLIKTPKPEGKSNWPNQTLAECPKWLDKEIGLLRPPVILVLGSLSLRHFIKEAKVQDYIGRVVFDKARDANLLIGFNPSQIYFDPSKQSTLNDIVAKIPDLLTE